MRSGDALWLHMERPTSSMSTEAILWFDEPLDEERLRQAVSERLVARFPRFRQRAVPDGWGFRWEDVLDFRLEEHVLTTALPAPAGRAELEALISHAASTSLDRARPLWRVQLVEAYGQGSALLVRMHHGFADGMTQLRLFLSLMDESPSGPEASPARDIEQEEVRRHLGQARWAYGARWLASLGRFLAIRPDTPSPLRGPLGVEKHVVWSDPLSLRFWRQLARGTGATLNDTFMAVVAGAVRRYVLARGGRAKRARANVAVQLRLPSEPIPRRLGNELGIWLAALPVDERDPHLRLREMSRRMSALKRSLDAVVSRDMMALVGKTRVTTRIGTRILGARCSMLVSNLRGPRKPVFLAGSRLAGAAFWMPPVLNAGLGVTLLSYAGEASLAVSADTGLIPHPREFLLMLHQEIRELAGVDSYAPILEQRL